MQRCALIRRSACAAAATLTAFGMMSEASAGYRTSTWVGTSGSWSTLANWADGVVPADAGIDQFDVLIDGGRSTPSRVKLNQSVGLNSLTIDDGDSLDVAAGNVLGLTSGLTVNGAITLKSNAWLALSYHAQLNGSGSILGTDGPSEITANNGSLTIGSGFTIGNSAVSTTGAMSIGGTSYPVINNGVVQSLRSTTTLTGQTITNNGVYRVGSGGTLSIKGPLTSLAQLGTVQNTDGTGRLRVDSTIENTGSTFTIDRDIAGLEFAGKIRGGTITAPSGRVFRTASGTPLTLENVTLNASTFINGNVLIGGDGRMRGNADVQLNSGLFVSSTLPKLTIDAGINLHGRGGIGYTSTALESAGTISADVPGEWLEIAGNPIVNTGTIRAANNGILDFSGHFTRASLGNLVNDGGQFRMSGQLENAGQVFGNDPAIDWVLDQGGAIVGGVIQTLPGRPLTTPADARSLVDGARLDGTMRLGANSILDIRETLEGSGTILFPALSAPYGAILVGYAQAIPGGAGVDTPIVIGPDITIRGGSGTIRGALLHGTAQADPNMRITLAERKGPYGAPTDTGIVVDGTLRTIGTGTIVASQSLTLGTGARVELDINPAASATAVPFSVTGSLDLSSVDTLVLTQIGNAATAVSRRVILRSSTGIVGRFERVLGTLASGDSTRALAVTYDAKSVYVQTARPGDSNLDEDVDFDDLLTLARNYNRTGTTWSTGDLDGTGTTAFADLLLLAKNYGYRATPTEALVTGVGLSASFSGDWALAQSLVPEPACLGLLVLPYALRRTRRRN